MSVLAKTVGFAGSGNPRLSALRINDEKQFLSLVARAIRLNHGIVLNAATALKINRNTLTKWINHYPDLRDTVWAARHRDSTGVE